MMVCGYPLGLPCRDNVPQSTGKLCFLAEFRNFSVLPVYNQVRLRGCVANSAVPDLSLQCLLRSESDSFCSTLNVKCQSLFHNKNIDVDTHLKRHVEAMF